MRQFRDLLLVTTALTVLALAPASAGPQGPSVVSGSATVTNPGTANVTVNQQSDRAIINWTMFNVGTGEHVQFNQPSSTSITLNRVIGGYGPSMIDGMIDANGRVFIINRDGILFGANAVASALTQAGAQVDVAMTEAATRFVTPLTFQALTGRTVWTDPWDTRMSNGMAHINLTREADLALIAPATADFMAKLAHGMSDDLLSALCLARDCPLYVAPAMNLQMWGNPATQRNVAQLRADGVRATVFRQQQGAAGWIEAPVAPNTATDIENAILTRARQLRIAQFGE